MCNFEHHLWDQKRYCYCGHSNTTNNPWCRNCGGLKSTECQPSWKDKGATTKVHTGITWQYKLINVGKDEAKQKIACLELKETSLKEVMNTTWLVQYIRTNWNLSLIDIQSVNLYNLSVYIIVASCLLFSKCMGVTLKRLHLGLSGQDLWYWFIIHKSTVSCIFASVTDLLFQCLEHLIRWPCMQTDILIGRLFQWIFGSTVSIALLSSIILNFFIYGPSDLARMQTYSSNELQNTVKCFIRLTPKGVFSYISNGWGGRVMCLMFEQELWLAWQTGTWGHHLGSSWPWH